MKRLKLLDENKLVLSVEAYEKFVEILNRPPKPNERLRRLLQEPSVLEKQG